MTITVEVKLDIPPRVARAFQDPQFALGPGADFIKRVTLELFSETVQNSPVGVAGAGGGLRGSWDTVFEDNGLTGIVGSDIHYAPYVEFGTRPHWPPINALRRWAYLKKVNPYLVARAIARRGTRPRNMMRDAVDTLRSSIWPREMNGLISDIQRQWGRLG